MLIKRVSVFIVFLLVYSSAYSQDFGRSSSSTEDFKSCICGAEIGQEYIDKHPEYGIVDISTLNNILDNINVLNVDCDKFETYIDPLVQSYIADVEDRFPDVEDVFDAAPSGCRKTRRFGRVGWPGFQGVVEHWIIESYYTLFLFKENNAFGEYAIPQSSPTGITGYADIADLTTCEIYEIKSDGNGEIGQVEAERYVLKANLLCPGICKDVPSIWTLGNSYGSVDLPYPFGAKYLKTWQDRPGVILYKQVPGNNPLPGVVILDERQLRKIKIFIQKIVNSVADLETAIKVFLDQNPDIANAIKVAAVGAAIAIIVTTIIEDIVTLGAGIADDPASFYVAYRLVAFAL